MRRVRPLRVIVILLLNKNKINGHILCIFFADFVDPCFVSVRLTRPRPGRGGERLYTALYFVKFSWE
jgi:hypothetical protein